MINQRGNQKYVGIFNLLNVEMGSQSSLGIFDDN